MLIIFSFTNLWTYFDRGALSAALERFEKSSSGIGPITELQEGVLGGAYMLGYVCSSPILAHMSNSYPPMRLMGLGLGVWTLATLSCGLAFDYYFLLFARMFTGVGEASFLVLAPPFIEKNAPPDRKSTWLSLFFLGIPLGYAFGAAAAGVWIGAEPFGPHWSWRWVFIAEAAVMLPIVMWSFKVEVSHLAFTGKSGRAVAVGDDKEALLIPNDMDRPETPASQAPEPDEEAEPFGDKARILLSNGVYIFLVLAYAAQTFVTGGFAYWGVKYVKHDLKFGESEAGAVFGGVTAAMGIVGTGLGGVLLDRVRARTAGNEHESLKAALQLVFYMNFVAWPAATFAFILSTTSRYLTLLLMAVCELFLFACISPINSALMWAVPTRLAPMAIAFSVVGTHVLGDAASPVIIGALLDRTDDNYRISMIIATQWLVWSVVSFGVSWQLAARRARKNAVLMLPGDSFPSMQDDLADYEPTVSLIDEYGNIQD